jgi:hypothetical protein
MKLAVWSLTAFVFLATACAPSETSGCPASATCRMSGSNYVCGCGSETLATYPACDFAAGVMCGCMNCSAGAALLCSCDDSGASQQAAQWGELYCPGSTTWECF